MCVGLLGRFVHTFFSILFQSMFYDLMMRCIEPHNPYMIEIIFNSKCRAGRAGNNSILTVFLGDLAVLSFK